jgi:carboxyl-terminal processing protease
MKWFFTTRTGMERRLTVLSILLTIVSLALVAQTTQKETLTKEQEDEQFYRFIDVAGEVYKSIQRQYVDEVASRKVLEGAIRGMFLVLDEHSQYLDADTLAQLEKDTEGEFSGIGIHITLRQGVLTVIAPIPGGPSARLGIQPWDRIIEIEGKSTEGITLQEAVRKLTGPPGTKVRIKIYRSGDSEPLEYTITRQTIKIESVYTRMLDKNIGYLRVAKFSDSTSADLRRAFNDLTEKGMKGLVFDLRFNTGGLLREAIEVSELFVPKGELIVSTKGRLPNQNRKYFSQKEPVIKIPVFVLVNEGTASASEIVAGAIQDHRLGVVIGPEIEGQSKNTFGKGSVQTIAELQHSIAADENGNLLPNAMRITTARYYTPNGRSIHNVGIIPDITTPIPRDFQANLLRHGMIGDPSQIEPGRENPELIEEELLEEPTSTPEPEQNTTEDDGESAPTATPTPDPNFYRKALPKPSDKAPGKTEEFRDIMLDQAVREMKVHLIIQGAQSRLGGRTLADKSAEKEPTAQRGTLTIP